MPEESIAEFSSSSTYALYLEAEMEGSYCRCTIRILRYLIQTAKRAGGYFVFRFNSEDMNRRTGISIRSIKYARRNLENHSFLTWLTKRVGRLNELWVKIQLPKPWRRKKQFSEDALRGQPYKLKILCLQGLILFLALIPLLGITLVHQPVPTVPDNGAYRIRLDANWLQRRMYPDIEYQGNDA